MTEYFLILFPVPADVPCPNTNCTSQTSKPQEALKTITALKTVTKSSLPIVPFHSLPPTTALPTPPPEATPPLPEATPPLPEATPPTPEATPPPSWYYTRGRVRKLEVRII